MDKQEQLLKAAEKVLEGIISSGCGPAAPCFDAEDYETERNRGTWYTVDGDAIKDLRKAVAEVQRQT